MTTNYITSDGDSVDSVAWKNYGTQVSRVVERLLEANPGLADLGPLLPAGKLVVLPDLSTTEQAQGVRLWD